MDDSIANIGDVALPVAMLRRLSEVDLELIAKGVSRTDEELSAVLEAAEAVDSRTAAMVWLMARSGLRIGEAMAVQRSDVDFTAGTITVERSLSRNDGVQPLKGREVGESRSISMPTDMADRLQRHFAEQTVTDLLGFVFTAPMGGPVNYHNWRERSGFH